jgi:hypothetical protein
MDLVAIAGTPQIFTPRCFLCVTGKIRPSDMVVMSELTRARRK